ncbi:MAG: hypothetical protein AB8U25_06275 [Rickettsiales endosymbiont of Dermacentor nuttalli]
MKLDKYIKSQKTANQHTVNYQDALKIKPILQGSKKYYLDFCCRSLLNMTFLFFVHIHFT